MSCSYHWRGNWRGIALAREKGRREKEEVKGEGDVPTKYMYKKERVEERDLGRRKGNKRAGGGEDWFEMERRNGERNKFGQKQNVISGEGERVVQW